MFGEGIVKLGVCEETGLGEIINSFRDAYHGFVTVPDNLGAVVEMMSDGTCPLISHLFSGYSRSVSR